MKFSLPVLPNSINGHCPVAQGKSSPSPFVSTLSARLPHSTLETHPGSSPFSPSHTSILVHATVVVHRTIAVMSSSVFSSLVLTPAISFLCHTQSNRQYSDQMIALSLFPSLCTYAHTYLCFKTPRWLCITLRIASGLLIPPLLQPHPSCHPNHCIPDTLSSIPQIQVSICLCICFSICLSPQIFTVLTNCII